ncbi:hypothetical protein BaRGS_00004130 [Batillaria attramentaria]|uniref:Uncharacterized protein n=1 Tax=Batillaria attramentaria TaxID=370345 RepID=A0ABD0LYV4_9CAEN
MSSLYSSNSLTTWASFPVWYSVRTFQHATRVLLFGFRASTFWLAASGWVWLTAIIRPVSWRASSPLPLNGNALVLVSVTGDFLRCRVVSPTPNLPPFIRA